MQRAGEGSGAWLGAAMTTVGGEETRVRPVSLAARLTRWLIHHRKEGILGSFGVFSGSNARQHLQSAATARSRRVY